MRPASPVSGHDAHRGVCRCDIPIHARRETHDPIRPRRRRCCHLTGRERRPAKVTALVGRHGRAHRKLAPESGEPVARAFAAGALQAMAAAKATIPLIWAVMSLP